MAVNEDKKLSDYEKKTLRELQQSSNTAYVPAFTETENYKFDAKELNGQVLQAGTNVTIDNNNVIRSTDTKLKSSDNINITSDNKLVYTGPQGEGTDLEEDSTNLTISRQTDGKYKVNLNLSYGSEVTQVHKGATTYNCTSTFFNSTDSGKSIKGNFAGFVNNCITFGREPYEDNVANSELNLVISQDISMQYWLNSSPDRWILSTADDTLSFKKVNGTYPPYASRIHGDYYTQLIFNTPNIAALTIHTWWLQHVTHRENVLIQVNKGQNMKTIYLFNGPADENDGASFYFYHNGLVYKKENVSKGHFVIIGSVQSNGDLYTDLSGPDITNGRANDFLYSLPFTVNAGRSDWCICTVQRFYCIHEVDDNNKHKYYFIESMY
jgi:hypothetical protein